MILFPDSERTDLGVTAHAYWPARLPKRSRDTTTQSRNGRGRVMRQLLLVGGFAALYLFVLWVFNTQHLLPQEVLTGAGIAIGALLTLFFAIFARGLNRRADDHALCTSMILCGLVVLLGVVYCAPATHLAFAPVLFTTVAFSTARLPTRTLLLLVVLALVGFAAVTLAHQISGIDRALVQMEWLHLMVTVIFLPAFILLSTRLRRMNQALFRAGIKIINIKESARRDPLIGCYNRRYVVAALEQQKRVADEFGTGLSLAMFDIDHFKLVNDQIGHLGGDQVLRSFGLTAQKFVRARDVFGRYGGEEFLLILPDTDLHTALEISERIRAQVEQFPWDVRLPTGVTVSIGVTQYIGGESVLDLFSRTDSAMYLAKSGGRNQVVVEEPAFD